MKDIRIYFEGNSRLIPGFREFFSEVADAARKQRRNVLPIATNGNPVRDFGVAQRKDTNSINILLLDAEVALDGKGMRQLQVAEFGEDRVFWMVQLMESWFLADRGAIKRYYDDDDFHESSLPKNEHVEQISKKDVLDGLKEATRHTRKGRYHKAKHAPGILQSISREEVIKRAPQCKRLFEVLSGLIAGESL